MRHINSINKSYKMLISIHALARSATEFAGLTLYPIQFQSTHSRGVRRCRKYGRKYYIPISIHALARSATIPGEVNYTRSSVFQSTHSRGVRPCNPCASRRSQPISIHALARSATKRN